MNGSFFLLVMLVIFALFFLMLASLRKLEPKREYGVKSVTERGEVMKSLAERTIADYFVKNNINYIYEKDAKGKFLFFNYNYDN